MPRLFPLALVLALSPAAPAADGVLFNCTVHTAAGDPVKNAVVVVKGGKIARVTDNSAKVVDLPADAIDLQGAVVIPGLVDTHSHVGIYPKPAVPAHQDGNEMSGPVQSSGRALDAIWPADPGVRMALAGGVTTANIMPGSGNVIGGQTVYVKLRGDTVEAMRITGKLADGKEVVGGLKMANGENPKGYGKKGQAPFTRMKVAALQREQFVKAREYLARRKTANETGKPFDRDLSLEPLAECLLRTRTVHFHCHRADDLLTAVRLADEFGFELVLQHGTEGYRIADTLAAKKIPVSLTLIDSPGGKAETIGLLEEAAAELDKAGVPVCINTDDFVTESRFILRTGGIAVRGGMSEAAALKALTLTPARVLHLDHRLGSLEPGKDADFVVLSGPPFSLYTKVRQTWIDGVKVFDAAKPEDRAYRDGGWGLPAGTKPPEVPAVAKPAPVSEPKAPPATREAIKPGNVYVLAGRVHTGTGEVIENGAVAVVDGKITAVGRAADVKRPFGAQVLTAAEVSPGLIDAYTSAGLSGAWNVPADQDQDEPSAPDQQDLRVRDGFNPREPLLDWLLGTGVTVLHSTPGRVNPLAGTSGVFRTHAPLADAALHPEAMVVVNLGEAPKTAFKDKGPGTRMGVAGLVRKAFADAQGYKAKREADDKTPRNPKHEALVPALGGRRPVVFAAHRADDLRTALRISDEFKLRPVIALGTEGFLLIDELAKRKVPVIAHPATQRPGGAMDTVNTLLGLPAALAARGISVTVGTGFEGYVPKQHSLRHEAALFAANGWGHKDALKAITLGAAELLGVDKDRGSLEAGKLADLVLYDGDPFEHATHVTHTLVGGRVEYDRSEYLARPLARRALPFAAGGGGVGCCLGW